jgi:16S rRNA (cytosine967-C5)-methyltransferase
VRAKEAGLSLPPRAQDPALHLSIADSVPLWIVQRLIAAYGFDTARAICGYREPTHPMTVRITKDRIAAPEFEALMRSRGWQFQSASLPGVYHVTGANDIGLDRAFQAGLYSVQGESSILAAMAVSPKPGQTVLDACAAPGGKTACLVEMMRGTGRVHAWDIHEHRVEIIRSMIKRLRLDTVRPAVRDATRLKEDWIASIDAVLLDAPCSGLGVMLSKPDVKYRQSPESAESLVALQAGLLSACCRYVKPGGTLVYSTCSILPEENGQQIEAFLKRHPQFAPDTEGLRRALPARYADRIENGMLQLFAHRDGMEGFFIARLKKEKP